MMLVENNDGEMVDQMVGAAGKEVFAEKINGLLA